MAKSDRAKLDAPKIEELVVKLKQIQSELSQNLSDLHQKIETLDAESELSSNRQERVKQNAEFRAITLESEVKQLLEQIKAIRELLGLNTERNLDDSN